MTRFPCVYFRPVPGALLALAFAASQAAAQTVRGTVRDSVNSKPIQAAVELLNRDGSVAVQVISGRDGNFVVKAPVADTFVLRVRRIGYLAIRTDALPLAASTDTTLSFRIAPRPVTLSGVVVSAARGNQFLENSGFYRRQKETTGKFLDPIRVDLLASKAKQTADILDGIPGVTLVSAGGSWGIRQPVLTRQMGCAGTLVGDDENTPTQWPRIYLDALLMNMGEQAFDLNTIPPVDILAIEVYNSVSEIPLQFGGTNAICGVIVIWTKR
ncbi:MAG: hypothetical protein EXR93_09480 [Gemmatimonadetes bacterium]|nr:hypothetical protein [Gemmatimonadota bacterium]